MAEAVNPGGIWQPFGAFSTMVLQGAGQVVHLKGQVSLDAAGEVVGPGDMRAQVAQVLANIRAALEAAGGRLSDIFALTQYTTDIRAFMACGDIRKAAFAPPYPITTTVEVAALYDTRLVVEITASAEIPRERFVAPAGAVPMHGAP